MFEEENGQTNGLLIVVKREEEEEEAVVVGFEEERMLVARQCLTQTMPFAAPEVCVCVCACACVSLSLFPPFFFLFYFFSIQLRYVFFFIYYYLGLLFVSYSSCLLTSPKGAWTFFLSLYQGALLRCIRIIFFFFWIFSLLHFFQVLMGEESLSLVISYHEERGVLFHICHPHSQ